MSYQQVSVASALQQQSWWDCQWKDSRRRSFAHTHISTSFSLCTHCARERHCFFTFLSFLLWLQCVTHWSSSLYLLFRLAASLLMHCWLLLINILCIFGWALIKHHHKLSYWLISELGMWKRAVHDQHQIMDTCDLCKWHAVQPTLPHWEWVHWWHSLPDQVPKANALLSSFGQKCLSSHHHLLPLIKSCWWECSSTQWILLLLPFSTLPRATIFIRSAVGWVACHR